MEKWKQIVGWDGYKVSNHGRVMGLKGQIKKFVVSDSGYHRVRLYKNGLQKDPYVHRLVANAFIKNPKNKPQINHKDKVKTNNHYKNLEWCTNYENAHHAIDNGIFRPNRYAEDHPRTKLTNEQAREIRNAVLTREFTRKKLSEKYGVGIHVIEDIRGNRSFMSI